MWYILIIMLIATVFVGGAYRRWLMGREERRLERELMWINWQLGVIIKHLGKESPISQTELNQLKQQAEKSATKVEVAAEKLTNLEGQPTSKVVKSRREII